MTKEIILKGNVVHAWGGESRLVVDGWVQMNLPSEFQVPEGTKVEVTIKVLHVPDILK